MRNDREVRVNWFNINIPTILAVASAAIGLIVWVNDLKNDVEESVEYRKTRAVQTDKNFADLNAIVRPLAEANANLTYRMGQNEGAIKATNERIDRLAENLLNSMEGLRKDVAALSTKVEVVSSKLDTLAENKRASLDRVPSELVR